MTAPDTPLLILAGAGSGKTRVLTRRIAWLIAEGGVAPWRIAGVTFTNKAAEEMRQRVAGLAGPAGAAVWLHTFHALGARLLRVHGTALGLPPGFSILDDDDSESLVKQALKTLGIAGDLQAGDAWRAIGKARGSGATAADFREMAEGPFDEAVARAWTAYDDAKARSGAVDFDDLILLPTRLLTEFPDVAARVHDQLTHVLVDEYQDTSPAQYRLLTALAGPARHLTCVGDPDQSIYRWRGADIRNILEFERDFPDARVVAMNQNYRSTGRILEAASTLIARNPQVRPKKLWTEGGPGRPIATAQLGDGEDEAHFVASAIAQWLRNGARASDFAVLYRTRAQSRALEVSFTAQRLPYQVFGGNFFARREIKDMLAWLRLLANPADVVSLTRALSAPPRGLGEVSLARLQTFAATDPRPVLELLGSKEFLASLPPRGRTAVADFLGVLNRMSEALAVNGYTAALTVALEESGYLSWLEQKHGGQSTDAADRRENLRELRLAMGTAEEAGLGLPEYLERAALMADLDRWRGESDLVTLMTLHNAKGLEFPHVFICGMEDGLLPHASSMDDPEELQEERRLLYVGMTRARESIVLTGARGRKTYRTYEQFTWSQPSRFLAELPEHLLVPVEVPADLPLAEDAVRRTPVSVPGELVRVREDDGGHADEGTDLPGLGEDVAHAHFGTGRVIAVTGRGADTRIVVSFLRYGRKTFLAGMARLTRVREAVS